MTEKVFDLSGSNNQVFEFSKTGYEIGFQINVANVVSFPITLSFQHGNIENEINSSNVATTDNMTELVDNSGNQIEIEIASNGNNFVHIETFYGNYGNIVIDKGTAVVGTVTIASN